MWFAPSVDGTTPIRGPAQAFVNAFVARIDRGLLRGAPPRRNRYAVTEARPDRLRFRATTWLSALNVGLNDVDLDLSSRGLVRFHIQYRQWALYGIALSAAIGLALIAFFVLFDLRSYIASHPGPQYLGLSVDQNIALAWGMALFWGFGWPWVLIGLHKRPLRRLMEQLIAEVDASERT